MQATNVDINYDKEAKNIGLITGIPEELYFCSISRASTVYVEFVKGDWFAWRESYVSNKKQCSSYKPIARGSFELVMARTKNYLNYLRRK